MMIGDNIATAIGLFSTCALMVLGLVATYPAVKAHEKGRNFTNWYFFSLVLFPVALMLALAMEKEKS